MSNNTTAAGDWIQSFFKDAAYQPDDSAAFATLERDISPGVNIIINGSPHSKADFVKLFVVSRNVCTLSLESSQELHASTNDPGVKICVVGHIQIFTLKSKATGETQRYKSMTICTVAQDGGKRRLVDLQEIASEISI